MNAASRVQPVADSAFFSTLSGECLYLFQLFPRSEGYQKVASAQDSVAARGRDDRMACNFYYGDEIRP